MVLCFDIFHLKNVRNWTKSCFTKEKEAPQYFGLFFKTTKPDDATSIIGLVFIRWVITRCNEYQYVYDWIKVRLLVLRHDSNGFPSPFCFRFII
jgi:hypothetical protein